MLQQIGQTKPHHQVHQQGTEITVLTQDNVIDPHLAITTEIDTITMIIRTDICLAGQDPIPTVIDTVVTVKVTHERVILSPITDPHTAAHHATDTEAHTTTDKMLHTEDPHHTEVFPGITVDPDHVHHTNTTTKHNQNHLTAPTGQPARIRTGNIIKSPFMVHHLSTTVLMNKPVNPMRI